MNRLQQLEAWAAGQLGQAVTLAPASADASFRSYWRLQGPQGSLIAMDAPPPQEDCRPFVQVAGLFAGAGVHVPQVLAADLDLGFLLLSDLGTRTYLDALAGGGDAAALYGDATAALVQIQGASRDGVLPAYDHTLLLRELSLFPDWYLQRHLGRTADAADSAVLARVFALLTEACLAQPRVWVHRDYHTRNLMVCPGHNPGILDFQDAVHGPITYDLVSLLRDAYVALEEPFVLDVAIRYWERARRAGLPVHADFALFYRDFEWTGLQRHLKVLGIFARLWHRDGKDRYLADLPRVYAYVLAVAGRYRELEPLRELLERLDAAPPAAAGAVSP